MDQPQQKEPVQIWWKDIMPETNLKYFLDWAMLYAIVIFLILLVVGAVRFFK